MMLSGIDTNSHQGLSKIPTFLAVNSKSPCPSAAKGKTQSLHSVSKPFSCADSLQRAGALCTLWGILQSGPRQRASCRCPSGCWLPLPSAAQLLLSSLMLPPLCAACAISPLSGAIQQVCIPDKPPLSHRVAAIACRSELPCKVTQRYVFINGTAL